MRCLDCGSTQICYETSTAIEKNNRTYGEEHDYYCAKCESNNIKGGDG